MMTSPSQQIGSNNYHQAMTLVNCLVLQGVKHAVISPGSRSTPLALACERHPQIKIWIHIDERSACFFALGLADRAQFPVIVIATSGSAVCNWLPAVSEANYSQIPLLLLSADRPNELQKVKANQTIDQANIFSSQVRDFFQLAENNLNKNELQQRICQAFTLSLWPKPGPVHINIPIREPLLPEAKTPESLQQQLEDIDRQVLSRQTSKSFYYPQQSISDMQIQQCIAVLNSGPGIIICGREQYGHQFIRLLEAFAEKLEAAVFVDPLSNIRLNHQSDNIIYNYDAFLFASAINSLESPKWVLRFGQLPVSKNLSCYLSELDQTQMLLVCPYGDFPDPLHLTDAVFYLSPENFIQSLLNYPLKPLKGQLLDLLKSLERQSAQVIQTHIKNDSIEGYIVDEVLVALNKGGLLFSANSMTIRDLDTFIYQKPLDKNPDSTIKIYANRGCSGIDGNVSSFFGLLANSDKRLPSIALLGDLTALHDSNGFLWAKTIQEQGYSATIIVLNNHGGAIFNYLPQKQLDCLERLWITDPQLDFSHLATLYGLHYQQVDKRGDFAKVLSTAVQYSGISLIEVLIDQKQSVNAHIMLKNALREL